MALGNFSERIRAKLSLVEPTLSAASLNVLRQPSPQSRYPEYMLTMHGISRAAVPLMEAAVRTAPVLEPDDSIVLPLVDYLQRHIPEERGHADWILEDLEVIGFDRSVILNRVPPAGVATLVGAQYYWIEHVHPIALIGYLAVMETNQPSLDAVDELARTTGFPPEAFRSMRLHARIDVEHRQTLYRAMDSLPIRPWHERLVGMSALHTVELLTQVLIELVNGFGLRVYDGAKPSVVVADVRQDDE